MPNRKPLASDETRTIKFKDMTPTEKSEWYAKRASEARKLDEEAGPRRPVRDAVVGSLDAVARTFAARPNDVGRMPLSSDKEGLRRRAAELRKEEPKDNVFYGVDVPRKIKDVDAKPFKNGGHVKRGCGLAKKGYGKGTMR